MALYPNKTRTAFLFGLIGALCAFSSFLPVAHAANENSDSLGTVRPMATVEPTMIAIPPFGRDESSPVEYETMPRIIRRDLVLSGFFQLPADQQEVNSQNIIDVRNNQVNFDFWRKMGVQHYLMGNVSSPKPGTLRVLVLLYDVPSARIVINRYFDGDANDPRYLAHSISDEIVKFTKFTDGIARTKLIYLSEQIPGIKETAIMDADGFNQLNLTRYNKICTTPTWGARGTEIYYTSYHGNRANIYGQQVSTGQTWPIAAYGGTNHSPDWCESNGRILMTLSKDGNSEIYSCLRDGKDARRLTKTKATEGSPCWSPDGTRYVYASNEAGGLHLFVANADGSGKKRLTTRGSWNDAPSWSADGQRIAFVSRIDGQNDIFVIHSDGDPNTYRRLTINQGDNESPSWGPNSRHLAFASNRSGRWQIYMMLDDGSNQTVLTSTGQNTQPDWGPYPGGEK